MYDTTTAQQQDRWCNSSMIYFEWYCGVVLVDPFPAGILPFLVLFATTVFCVWFMTSCLWAHTWVSFTQGQRAWSPRLVSTTCSKKISIPPAQTRGTAIPSVLGCAWILCRPGMLGGHMCRLTRRRPFLHLGPRSPVLAFSHLLLWLSLRCSHHLSTHVVSHEAFYLSWFGPPRQSRNRWGGDCCVLVLLCKFRSS